MRFILEAPSLRAAFWRALYLADFKSGLRRLSGNRKPERA